MTGRCRDRQLTQARRISKGSTPDFAQMHELTGPDDATRLVDYWASEGMTSFKAYMNITRDELSAAIHAAHAHKMKLTGHLCSVTWPEAIALGIDDLEHGPVFADTEFIADKKPIYARRPAGAGNAWSTIPVDSPQVKEFISNLVAHHVAVTSTLPVFEAGAVAAEASVSRYTGDVCRVGTELSHGAGAHIGEFTRWRALMRKEMDFEFAFVEGRWTYCWPGQTRPETAACYLDSGISARWNCWLRRDSLPWRPFTLQRKTVQSISANRSASGHLESGQAGGHGAHQGRSFKEHRGH